MKNARHEETRQERRTKLKDQKIWQKQDLRMWKYHKRLQSGWLRIVDIPKTLQKWRKTTHVTDSFSNKADSRLTPRNRWSNRVPRRVCSQPRVDRGQRATHEDRKNLRSSDTIFPPDISAKADKAEEDSWNNRTSAKPTDTMMQRTFNNKRHNPEKSKINIVGKEYRAWNIHHWPAIIEGTLVA